MTIPKGGHDETAKRRDRAEEIARGRSTQSSQNQEAMSLEETQRMLHELQVHQIELELQNEELRRAQAELDAAGTRYFDFYDLAPVGYVTLSAEGLILEANLTAASLLGVARDALIKQRFSNFILPEDQDILYLHCKKLFAAGEARAWELRMVKNDGTSFWARSEEIAVRDAHGAVVRRIVLSDITERKRAEEVLRESEDRHARTLDAVNDGLWDWHIPSGKAFFSALYYTMLGYQNGEFPATYDAWRLLVHPEDIDRVERELRASVQTGNGFRIDLRMRKKDDQWLWVSTRGKMIERDADRKALRMVGILSDITERKRAEEELANLETQNRQLQKSESLGRMAGAIAHHFNNQLMAVTGNLELALGDLPPNIGSAENVNEAMKAAHKAAEVSSLMLTYLGQTHCKHEPLDLSEACLRRLPMLQAALPREVVLETDLPSPGPAIQANENQIQQVLTNLFINAWEASVEKRGTIRLAVRPVSAEDFPAAHRFPIDWQPHDPVYACLEVADTGCGIPAQDLEKIFDPFFSSKFPGRGMGLAVVLGIVRTHDGAITVASEPDRGSVFRVFLPLSAEAVECLKPIPFGLKTTSQAYAK